MKSVKIRLAAGLLAAVSLLVILASCAVSDSKAKKIAEEFVENYYHDNYMTKPSSMTSEVIYKNSDDAIVGVRVYGTVGGHEANLSMCIHISGSNVKHSTVMSADANYDFSKDVDNFKMIFGVD